MELKVFAVKDIKAEVYLQPMFFRTDAEAIRAFSVACADSSHEFHRHAEDYVLFGLGAYSDETALIQSFPSPIRVMSGIEASQAHSKHYAARLLTESKVA